MKKIIFSTALAAMLAVSSATAAMLTVTSVSDGGQFAGFTAKLNNGAAFDTFCLETSEFLPNGTHKATISNAATLGGGGAIGGMDIISKGTEALYLAYIRGVQAVTGISRLAIQQAFWALESEVAQNGATPGDWNTNLALKWVLTQFTKTEAMEDYDYTKSSVRVINPYKEGSANSVTAPQTTPLQSVLVSVPDAASTLALLGLGLLSLAAFRRRMSVA